MDKHIHTGFKYNLHADEEGNLHSTIVDVIDPRVEDETRLLLLKKAYVGKQITDVVMEFRQHMQLAAIDTDLKIYWFVTYIE